MSSLHTTRLLAVFSPARFSVEPVQRVHSLPPRGFPDYGRLPVEPVQSPASTANVPVEDLPKDEPEVTQNSNNPEEIVAPEGHGFYQVVDGDTLQSIAISFGTNADELKRLNKLSDDKNSLHIGDYVLVPVPDDSLYES